MHLHTCLGSADIYFTPELADMLSQKDSDNGSSFLPFLSCAMSAFNQTVFVSLNAPVEAASVCLPT